MQKVTRYDLDMDGSMESTPHGDYVRFDDCKELVEELEVEIEYLKEKIKNAQEALS